jgi:hypothetical protein
VFFVDFSQLDFSADSKKEDASQKEYMAFVPFQYLLHIWRRGLFFSELVHKQAQIKLSIGIP